MTDITIGADRPIPADVEPLRIIYEGLDANNQSIDMAQLAKSLDGMARIIAVTSNFSITSVYQKHYDALQVRVRVESFEPGSFVVLAALDWINQSQLIQLGYPETLKAIWAYVFSKLGAKDKNQMDANQQTLLEALRIQSAHSEALADKYLSTINLMATDLGAAAKNASTPIGESVSTVTFKVGQETAASWDANDRKAIMERNDAIIQPEQQFTVQISELDVENGTAKVAFNNSDHRIRARISDPIVRQANNPYATALTTKQPITVKAKSEIIDGQISMLYINDSIAVEP